MSKVRVKCQLYQFLNVGNNRLVAYVYRLSSHPELGPPTGGISRTSLVLHINLKAKEFETLNTTYWWE